MIFVRAIALAIVLSLLGLSATATEQRAGKTNSGAVLGTRTELVDINHATLAELKTLPGVGEAYSLAIVKHRPYKNKTQLRSKGVIPLAAYKKIKDQIIARQ